LSGVAACSCEQGDEAVDTSDLIEHLITDISGGGRKKSRGYGVPHRKKNNEGDASLEIEKTKH